MTALRSYSKIKREWYYDFTIKINFSQNKQMHTYKLRFIYHFIPLIHNVIQIVLDALYCFELIVDESIRIQLHKGERVLGSQVAQFRA